jgi:peptidoglycan/xylan/chitin deacetylase (PgdA/CDA1 family)
LLAVEPPPPLENGVPNGTLEQSSASNPALPNAWRTGGFGTNTASFAYDNDAHGGSHAVAVTISGYTSGDAKWVFEPVSALPSQRYAYRDFYKSAAPTRLVAVFQRADGVTSYLTVGSQLGAAAAWTQAQVEFVTPADVARLSVWHVLASAGSLRIDDVGLKAVETPDLSSGVPNGSFEQTPPFDGNHPLAWQTGSWGANTPAFAFATDAHTGSHSVRVTVSSYSSGDAKWYFDPVPVVPNSRYLYSDYYKSNAESFIIARFTRTDGTYQYVTLERIPASAAYANAKSAFLVPSQVTALTIFRGLARNGSLTIDDAALTAEPPIALIDGVPNGNLEQETFPGSNMPAAFHTNEWGEHQASFVYGADGRGGGRSVHVDMHSYQSGNASWYYEPQLVDPRSVYDVRLYYRSNVDTRFEVVVTLSDRTTTDLQLPFALASQDWALYSTHVRPPANAVDMTVYHGLSRVGSLTIDDVARRTVTSRGFARALVSLTFDDNWSSIHANALPVLDRHGVKATHYVISGTIGGTDRLDLAQLRDLQTRGHEIGSHTVSHRDLTSLGQTDLTHELAESKRMLESNGFGPVRNIATPYGSYGTASLSSIRQTYASHRTTDTGYNAADDFDRYRLKCQSMRSTTSSEEVEQWAARAAAERTWLIVLYHDVSDTPNIYGTTPERLEAHLRSMENHGLVFVTVQQALDEIATQL